MSGAKAEPEATGLERLHDQAAECAMLSAEATDRIKRDLFRKLYADLTTLANRVESVLNGITASDTFVGRKTYEPFPGEDD
jgi:hypothetical protein